MTPKVSVHIIAKEVSNYGKILFETSLKSLLHDNEGYADEVVLFDDGCSCNVRAMYQDVLSGYMVKCMVGENRNLTFAGKRNKCLNATDPAMTHIHWIDTDDIYFPNTLMPFKEKLSLYPDMEVWVSHFIHCMICPWFKEAIYPKNNIFKCNPDIEWKESVHERLDGVDESKSNLSGITYYHAGYTRSVIATAIKWIYYSVLEHGKDNCCYLRDNEVMYNEGIDAIIADRLPKLEEITKKDIPHSIWKFLNEIDGKCWMAVTTYGMDPMYGEFLDRHREIAKQEGHWGKAIEEVIEKELWRMM